MAQHLATNLVEDTYLGRAAFNKPNTNDTWFFNGAKYVKVTVEAHDQNPIARDIVYGPHEIFYEWKSLWRADFGQIDAMVPVPGTQNREAYVFSGTEYARIKDNFQELSRPPRPIAGNWRSLTGEFAKALCGALIDPANTNRIFFFSGNRYVHVEWNAAYGGDTVVGAVANISTRWTTIPDTQKFNTIFPDPRDPEFAYLFSGTKYWRIKITPGAEAGVLDAEGKNVVTFWPSLRKARFI